jgi:hypothetical protein
MPNERIKDFRSLRVALDRKRSKKADHAMDRDDFEWDVEGAEMAGKVEAMTEEEAKEWYMREFGLSSEEYDRTMAELDARIDGSIFDDQHKNKGNA